MPAFFFLTLRSVCDTIVLSQMRHLEVTMYPLTDAEKQALCTCSLFCGTDEGLLAQLLSHADAALAVFHPGDTVYEPHRFQRRLGILLDGCLQVTKGGLSISALHPGDLFGAAALYSDAEDFATTITAAKPSRCLLLEQTLVDDLLAGNSRIRENYLRYLTGRIRFLSGRLQSLAQPGAEGKLARYLLAGGADCSATELAHRLGISRATLYRAFDSLERSGLITRSGKTISVADPAALEALV